MKYALYKLKFLSSVHIGTREGFRESTDIIIHSDTLFSAFCNAFSLLYGADALETLLDRFRSNKIPFLISSTFPYLGNNLYFPVPFNKFSVKKDLKKIQYVEKSQFEKLLLGKSLEDVIADKSSIPEIPLHTANTPRLAINRFNNSPGENFFFFAELFFPADSGLFFLVDFKETGFTKTFNAVLQLLSHEGIGGDRTAGKGHFRIESISELEIHVPENLNGNVLLSLYYPKKDEFNLLENGYYDIIERKGYIYSSIGKNLRRKTVRMIVEGSVIPGNPAGEIVDVTPEIFKVHRIERYGLCFSVPCTLEEKI
ncbi:MAG TPA: type III-A CRISPR-associated RAMP protein Csm4 [bacterium]|nr:type III-A CRISPR-associated RAMP protein Csm4 [bacterium]HOL35108.1 type III-A CRISPR-associated RAMP protein Csm4 [bacterium]HPP08369.1 type III-A CRISPR-associated RAMP protein Csm4 [bacterium]